MNSYFKFFLAFTCIINLRLTANAQTIDTSPLDAYWKMIEPLKTGDSLSVDVWQDFLKIESNQIYIENQGFTKDYLERLRKAIQVVYMPQNDSLLQTRLVEIKKDPSKFWLTYKVYVYKQNESELKKYEAQLKNQSYLDSTYKNSFQMLPKRLQKKDTSVNIHFLGIENDAIAGGGTIIATLWSAYNQDKLKQGILSGHEMHHVLRGVSPLKTVSENEKGIMYFLNSVVNEGTADMIDKTYVLAHENELPMEFQFSDFLLFQADSIIRQVDTTLLAMANSKGEIFKTEKDYRNLIRWTSGHCPGYYMADIIVRNGYKKQMIKNVQNPFYFFYLYNKTARKDKAKPPVFSATSIEYVKMLEKKYWLSNRQRPIKGV